MATGTLCSSVRCHWLSTGFHNTVTYSFPVLGSQTRNEKHPGTEARATENSTMSCTAFVGRASLPVIFVGRASLPVVFVGRAFLPVVSPAKAGVQWKTGSRSTPWRRYS
jgi:hypothetical protein